MGITREHKYRAWDTVERTMVPWEDILGNLWLYLSGHYTEKYPIMQYTGLKDSQAIEEYFGDIIIVKFGEVWDLFLAEDWSMVIQYVGLYTKESYYFWELAEHYIVGNIYENKELLEGNL